MRIYFSHSRDFDFKQHLYQPIKSSVLNTQHKIIFPHEEATASIKTKEVIKTCQLLVAEISFPSIGLGIELGWADEANVPITCVYKTNSKISESLKLITNNFIEYSDAQDLVKKLEVFLSKFDVG